MTEVPQSIDRDHQCPAELTRAEIDRVLADYYGDQDVPTEQVVTFVQPPNGGMPEPELVQIRDKNVNKKRYQKFAGIILRVSEVSGVLCNHIRPLHGVFVADLMMGDYEIGVEYDFEKGEMSASTFYAPNWLPEGEWGGDEEGIELPIDDSTEANLLNYVMRMQKEFSDHQRA